jgi:membrane-bound metal-dependent hydrolase YbcI (DUF457 family)
MLGRTHVVIGVTTAVGVGYVGGFGLPVTGGLALAAFAGSKLPDRLEGGIFEHRGTTHRIWFTAIVAAVIAISVYALWEWSWFQNNLLAGPKSAGFDLSGIGLGLSLVLAAGIAIGYGMHLVADMCTIHGLDVGGKRVHLLPKRLRIRTGSKAEVVVRYAIQRIVCPLLVLLVIVSVFSGCGGSDNPPPCSAPGAEQWAAQNGHLALDKIPPNVDTNVHVGTEWPRLVTFEGVPNVRLVAGHVNCVDGRYSFVGHFSYQP